jgi:chitodextrinase
MLTCNAPSQVTSVRLTWIAPGDDGDVGTASQYDIRYSESPITDQNWDSTTQIENEPTPEPAGNQQTMIITNLEPNTTYYFAMKAADEADNWSALSNVVSVTTIDNYPPGIITTLTVEALYD